MIFFLKDFCFVKKGERGEVEMKGVSFFLRGVFVVEEGKCLCCEFVKFFVICLFFISGFARVFVIERRRERRGGDRFL